MPSEKVIVPPPPRISISVILTPFGTGSKLELKPPKYLFVVENFAGSVGILIMVY
jgi:hypothetical protein